MATHDIIVIGASMGGINALSRLLRGLFADLPASVFIVQHLGSGSPGTLDRILDRAGPLPVTTASSGQPFERGRVYVARSGFHLLIRGDRMFLSGGPKENRTRPAIDPLFRSAAVHHGPRVVGVILTGMLDDGVAGLQAIGECGGKTIVQHPDDAEYPEMPQKALLRVRPDYTLRLAEIPDVLSRLAQEPCGISARIPKAVLLEDKMADLPLDGRTKVSQWGPQAPLSCPECGGPLQTREEDGHRRYRCYVGHAYTGDNLLLGQDETVERSLWVAIRTLQDRAKASDQLAQDAQERGHFTSAHGYLQRATEARDHAERLQSLLLEHLAASESEEDEDSEDARRQGL